MGREPFKREASLRAVRHWLSHCSQNLMIIAPSGAGKTYFARQLKEDGDCVAAHFCRSESPDTTEPATLCRSIATQLATRFPNLALPSLSTVTLLTNISAGLREYLRIPLAGLPPSSRAMFVVIDDVSPHSFDLVLEIASCFPSWLRLVITSQYIPSTEIFRFKAFHELVLSENVEELSRFIELRLPQCASQEVFDASQDSWAFVEDVARGIERGILAADHVPLNADDLFDDLATVLPMRMHIYLALIKAARLPPSYDQLLSVCQLVVNDNPVIVERELEQISHFFESTDPVLLRGKWREHLVDLGPYHAAWAEFYKTKPRKKLQDIIELAYHLAHSCVPPMEAIRTLASVGAADLVMRCSVIDLPTSALLLKAGATLMDQGTEHDFVYHCATGNLQRVNELLSSTSDKDCSMGLLAAASAGHVEICSYLLDTIPSIMAFGGSALRSAAANNRLGVLELLLTRGVHVDDAGPGGRTALRAAAWSGHVSVVELLLDSGAAIDGRDSEGRTALMASAFMNHDGVVSTLIESGADIDRVDTAGATALHLALSSGTESEHHIKTVELLLKDSLTKADVHGRHCIHLAAFHGDSCLEEIMKRSFCIDVQDALGRTPLMLAASQGRINAIDYLVAKEADIDAIDSHGRTALQLAAAGGHVAAVDLLLRLGADEAHKDNDGSVALHYAAAHNDVALSRALATSATIAASDRLGHQALLVAAQNNCDAVVAELLEMGANVDAATLDGQTALRAAAMNGNFRVVQTLAGHVRDWDQRDLDGTPLLHNLLIAGQIAMVELLVSLGASPSAEDAHGRSCAHVVCSTDDLAAARLLRRLGVLFNERDAGGRTALMTSVWAGRVRMAQFMLEVVGVDPNAEDKEGAAALSIAAQLGHREMVALLLRLGADPNLRDRAGRTALDVAMIAGHNHIRSLLQTATGSADSSGFGSLPASPLDTRSLGRRSFHRGLSTTLTTSPRVGRRIL